MNSPSPSPVWWWALSPPRWYGSNIVASRSAGSGASRIALMIRRVARIELLEISIQTGAPTRPYWIALLTRFEITCPSRSASQIPVGSVDAVSSSRAWG